MVNSQEIIERSIYVAILNMAIKLGYTINPEDYLPTSAVNAERFKEDLKRLLMTKVSTSVYSEWVTITQKA